MTFLTGNTHGRPDRLRPEARTVDERVSLEAVVNAITDIMGDHNRFGIADRTLAARIGREVQTAVAAAVGTGRISSTAQLTGQQAFWSILTQHLASTSSAHTDQQARQSLLHYMRHNANRTGADFANFVAQFRRGGGYAERAGDRDGSATLTSARFDGFSGADAAVLSAMRRSALDAGLSWAADRPEILRMLGHEGIRALREAQFSRESFQALRGAGFQEQDAARIAVGIARHANQHGLDANELARRVAASPGVLGGGNAAAEQEWRDRMIRFFANPQDAEARAEMNSALDAVGRSGTPAQREHVDRLRPLLNLEAQLTTDAQAETAIARADREAREAEAARVAERARQEAAERARAEDARAREAERVAREETERARLAALMGGGPAPVDAPAPAVQEGPAAATGQQQAEARPPSRLTVAPT